MTVPHPGFQLSDLYDADRRTRDEVAARLASWMTIPHPLYEVRYADGVWRDTTAGRVLSQGRTAGPVTVWCFECNGPADVVDEFEDQVGYEEQARPVWVRAFDCGHTEDQPIPRRRYQWSPFGGDQP